MQLLLLIGDSEKKNHANAVLAYEPQVNCQGRTEVAADSPEFKEMYNIHVSQDNVHHLVELMAGEASKNLTADVTHLVAGEVGSQKYTVSWYLAYVVCLCCTANDAYWFQNVMLP